MYSTIANVEPTQNNNSAVIDAAGPASSSEKGGAVDFDENDDGDRGYDMARATIVMMAVTMAMAVTGAMIMAVTYRRFPLAKHTSRVR